MLALIAFIGASCELVPGDPISGLDLPTGFQWEYWIDVPGGATDLTISTDATNGDVDIYVRFDQSATPTENDCSSAGPGPAEQCVIPSPLSGRWYVLLDVVSAADDVDIVGDFSGVIPVSGVLYRLNAGGPIIGSTDGGPDWASDTDSVPLVAPPVGHNGAAGVGAWTINSLDPSVAATTPIAVFQTERTDPPTGNEMSWTLPAPAGLGLDVRLYLGNGDFATKDPGDREFDVTIDGATVANDVDPAALFGHKTGGMLSFPVTSDGVVDIEFLHQVDDPLVNAIEIVRTAGLPDVAAASPSLLSFGQLAVGSDRTEDVTIENVGSGGDPNITISSATVTGSGFSTTFSGPVGLPPGGQASVPVTFTPSAAGATSGTLTINHNGTNDPLVVNLTAEGVPVGAIGFNASGLVGASVTNPTSLQWGPDGRLYVSEQSGSIKAFTVSRSGSGVYQVTDTETINLVKQIPNHNDDGSPAPTITTRQVTGILVAGSAANVEVYVTSSDPRIAVGNTNPPSQSLDTNSGVVSKLTQNGGSWNHQLVVEGLARSEENHSVNGMQLVGNTLYVVVGGNTNKGAPSNNFSFLPEYATATAVLTVDLAAIGSGTYSFPTLGRSAGSPPWGGTDGATQSMLEVGGPIGFHSTGWRNAYDLVITTAGDTWVIDNGPNGGWGGPPVGCNHNSNESDSYTTWDNLHLAVPGYYGGHPNPTRAGAVGSGWPGSPVPPSFQDPQECTYLPSEGPANAGQDGALATFGSSTNGIVEYTASNFGTQMQGDLLLASFDGTIYRVKPDGAGGLVTLGGSEPEDALLSGFGAQPLDVTAVGDTGLFPGTIWAATYGSNDVTVFEPLDYSGGTGGPCTGANDPGLDEDSDGYDNADEIANGTDPCSGGSQPPDFDGDFTSDLLDPDDDDDGTNDVVDAFALDDQNGLATTLPLLHGMNSGEFPNTFEGVGFTGWMLDPAGTTDYLNQYDPDTLTVGGASGVFTIDDVTAGDATGSSNDQDAGFQFGVAPFGSTFTARTQIDQPFPSGFTPADDQAVGLSIGPGDQDNFASVQVIANGGSGGVRFTLEQAGVNTPIATVTDGSVLGDAVEVDLYLEVDPVTGATSAYYSVGGGPPTLIGATTLPTTWFDGPEAIGVGLLSTSVNSGVEGTASPFIAQWDEVELTVGGVGP